MGKPVNRHKWPGGWGWGVRGRGSGLRIGGWGEGVPPAEVGPVFIKSAGLKSFHRRRPSQNTRYFTWILCPLWGRQLTFFFFSYLSNSEWKCEQTAVRLRECRSQWSHEWEGPTMEIWWQTQSVGGKKKHSWNNLRGSVTGKGYKAAIYKGWSEEHRNGVPVLDMKIH